MGELVVITGVSRGIGRAAALKFADRGADLALLGRPSERYDATVADCSARGARVQSYACDMADADQVAASAEALLAQLGPPAVVVNNAARLERGADVQKIDIDVWDSIMAINLRGPFLLSRALLDSMLERGCGRLLHIASVSGTVGCPQMAHYGASKWGLIGFHRALSEELRGRGVQSIAILPGSVDTDMLKKTPFNPDMSAEEVADVIIYYGLDAPAAVHGATVQVYG